MITLYFLGNNAGFYSNSFQNNFRRKTDKGGGNLNTCSLCFPCNLVKPPTRIKLKWKLLRHKPWIIPGQSVVSFLKLTNLKGQNNICGCGSSLVFNVSLCFKTVVIVKFYSHIIHAPDKFCMVPKVIVFLLMNFTG